MANDDGVELDSGTETATQTVEADSASDSETIAQKPEIQAAFDRTFNKGEAKATAQRKAKEEAEELAEESAEAGKTDDAGDDAATDTVGSDDSDTDDEPGKVKPEPASGKTPDEEALATLDPVLRRQAQRAGWTDEEIAEAIRLNPDAALRQFEKLHGSWNDLSRKWGQMGSAAAQQPQAQQQPQPQQQRPQLGQQQQPATSLDALFSDEGLRQFAEENGQDIVEKLIKPIRDEIVQPFRQLQEFYRSQRQDMIAQQVGGVFKSWEGDHSQFFGTTKAVSQEQAENRYRVAQMADQISIGASQQGVRMGMEEAFERALAILTEPHRSAIERKKLTSAIQNRSARLTTRPTQRQTPQTAADGAKRSDKAAMTAVENWFAQRGQ